MEQTTINDLCNLFDKHEIVELETQIDREYYASTDAIFTDGEIKSNITRDGYIHITSVKNANFLMFVDIEHNIYLCIYKYIFTTKFKYIRQKLQILRSRLEEIKENVYADSSDEKNTVIDCIAKNINDDVIDINTFTCECGSKEKMIFTRSKNNYEAIEAKCKACKSEYVFVPSKYYKLASKKLVYFKSEESSRQINILNNTITIDNNPTVTEEHAKPKTQETKNELYNQKSDVK